MTYVDFSQCHLITKIPDLSMTPYIEHLNLRSCCNLVEVDDSVGHLDKLKVWDLMGCSKLETLPRCLTMKSLTCVHFSGCASISKIPDLSMTPNIEYLNITFCRNLVEVDDSVGRLDKLRVWELDMCAELKTLPSCLTMKSLEYFKIFGCRRLKKFPNILHKMKGFRELLLWDTGISELPPSFGNLTGLRVFDITAHSTEVIHLPGSIYNLQHLETLTLEGNIIFPKGFSNYVFPRLRTLLLCSFTKGSEDFIFNCCCPLLEELDIGYCEKIVTLPESISRFERLYRLRIYSCDALQEIPRLPRSIRYVYVDVSNFHSLDSQSLFHQVSLSLSQSY